MARSVAHLKRQVRRFSENKLIRGRNVALNDANWLFTAERHVFFKVISFINADKTVMLHLVV